MKNYNDIFVIIGKVLSGNGDRKDRETLDGWKRESDENQRLFELYQQVWENTLIDENYSNHKYFLNDLKKRIAHIKQQEKREYRNFNVPTYLGWRPEFAWYRGGIAAIVIFMVAFFYIMQIRPADNDDAKTDAVQFVLNENARRQRTKIPLADGSIVWLNSESSIRYEKNMSDSVRWVELKGEAFFQVSSDSLNPFVVVAGDIITTATGTSFNIRNFADLKETTVFLNSGTVSVHRQYENTYTSEILKPGFGLSFDNKSSNYKKFEDVNRDAIAWKDGVLKFNNIDFEDAIKELERWYGVEISVSGMENNSKVAGWDFTGEYKNEYLSNVLKSMAYGRNFDYVIKGNKVEIALK